MSDESDLAETDQTEREDGVVDGSSTVIRSVLIKNPLVILSVLGIVLYAVSRGGYQVFYAKFGVAPEEVGLDYIGLLSRQALPVALLLAFVASLVGPYYWAQRRSIRYALSVVDLVERQRDLARRFEDARSVADGLRRQAEDKKGVEGDQLTGLLAAFDREQAIAHLGVTSARNQIGDLQRALNDPGGREKRAREKRTISQIAKSRRRSSMTLIALLGVVGWISFLFLQASLAGRGTYSPPFPLAPLQAEVQETKAFWLRDDTTIHRIGASDLGITQAELGACQEISLLYLGSANSLVVLYERCTHQVVRLPQDAVYLG